MSRSGTPASGDVTGSMAQARVVLVAVSERTLVPRCLSSATHVPHGPALVHSRVREILLVPSAGHFPDQHGLKSPSSSCRYLLCLGQRSPALQACNRTRNTQADGVPKGARALAAPRCWSLSLSVAGVMPEKRTFTPGPGVARFPGPGQRRCRRSLSRPVRPSRSGGERRPHRGGAAERRSDPAGPPGCPAP